MTGRGLSRGSRLNRSAPLRRALIGLAISLIVSIAGVFSVVPASASGKTPSGVTPSYPQNPGYNYNELRAVSCVRPTFCVAAGDYTLPNGVASAPLIETFDGGKWRTDKLPSLGPSITSVSLYGISCSSDQFCTAVGTYAGVFGANEAGGTLILTLKGRSWTALLSPPQNPDYLVLTGVSCIGQNWCMAVGSNNGKTLTEFDNGNGWVTIPSADIDTGYSGDSLSSVSCISETSCVAVGEDFGVDQPALIESFDGTNWTVSPSPDINQGAGVEADVGLEAVSCSSATFCVAVGRPGSIALPIVEQFNGTTWTLGSAPGVPNPDGYSTGDLAGVSCISAASCDAVGNSYPAGGGTGSTLWEGFNGLSWSITPSPNPGDPERDNLSAISCPTATFCMAVGTYDDTSSGDNFFYTLGETLKTSGKATSYVALGDSFSSGEGIPPYFEPNNKCHRSTAGYPTQVDVPLTAQPFDGAAGYGWGFLACSGASTAEVQKDQVTTKRDKSNTNGTPLSTSTALVTITAGGDDLRWGDVLAFCYQKFTGCENDSYKGYATLTDYATAALNQLQPRLVALYQSIAKLAPNGRILVLGYPQLLPATTAEQDCVELYGDELTHKTPIKGLDNDEQNWFRKEETDLNTTINSAVTKSSVSASFVPVATQFAGHEICGSAAGGEWINGPSLTAKGGLHLSKHIAKNSFHPNATGQAEYANIINQYLSATSG